MLLALLLAVNGIVIDSVTKSPIPNATVKLYQGDKATHTATTNPKGEFTIADVPAGQYRAYFDANDYSSYSPDRPFAITAAQPNIEVNAELVPYGEISGRVLNTTGEPLKDVGVGMRQLWHEHWVQTTFSTTGGSFRIKGLQPGTWILAALPAFRYQSGNPENDSKPNNAPTPEDGQRLAWASTFFPNSIDLAGAEKIIVRPGVKLDGLDIRLRTVPVHRVTGAILDSDGHPVKASVVLLDYVNKGAFSRTVTSNTAGEFHFDEVKDGEYRLYAQATAANQSKQKQVQELRVSRRDVTGIELRLSPPFPVKGFVDRRQPRDSEGKRKVTAVYLMPQDSIADMQTSAFHDQDGNFTINEVYPGRYRVLPAGFTPGFYVESIFYGEQDVTTQPIEIQNPPFELKVIYKSGAARVTGSVEKGPGTWVVLIPQDEALRDAHQFIRRAKADENGKFAIDSLRPGPYYALAFDRLEVNLLEDPTFTRKLTPSAQSVTLEAQSSQTLNLRPTAFPDY